MGSATKLWTAVLCLSAAQNGTLDLDEPVYTIVDSWLTNANGTSLLQLWNGDTTINTVTTRHLLGMRAGLQDYDDQKLKAIQPNKLALPTNQKSPPSSAGFFCFSLCAICGQRL